MYMVTVCTERYARHEDLLHVLGHTPEYAGKTNKLEAEYIAKGKSKHTALHITEFRIVNRPHEGFIDILLYRRKEESIDVPSIKQVPEVVEFESIVHDYVQKLGGTLISKMEYITGSIMYRVSCETAGPIEEAFVQSRRKELRLV